MSFKYVLFSYPRTESVKYGQDFDFNTILEMIEETNTKYSDVAAEVCLLCENIIWYLKIKLECKHCIHVDQLKKAIETKCMLCYYKFYANRSEQ